MNRQMVANFNHMKHSTQNAVRAAGSAVGDEKCRAARAEREHGIQATC